MTKVAIVEDNETMRNMLVDLINSEPEHTCVCACTTAEEALREIPKHQVDVALMDIHLPDGSGIVCTAQLTACIPELQVVILTVYKDTELILQALKAGACGYMLKRSRPEEILQAIAEVRSGGAPMTSSIARMVVRSFRTPAKTAANSGLSLRETEILELLAKGISNKEIADKINISAGTVRNHLQHIFKKLHVRSRTEAAINYLRRK